MSEDREPQETPESSPDYQRGWREGQEAAKRDLANILRIHAVGSGEPDDETLSDAKVREIFAGVFGAMATEQEFGTEPTGNFDVERLIAYANGEAQEL